MGESGCLKDAAFQNIETKKISTDSFVLGEDVIEVKPIDSTTKQEFNIGNSKIIINNDPDNSGRMYIGDDDNNDILLIPNNNSEVSTKYYADSQKGLNVKKSCRVATTGQLTAVYGDNTGVADTLTSEDKGEISIDGITLSLHDHNFLERTYI